MFRRFFMVCLLVLSPLAFAVSSVDTTNPYKQMDALAEELFQTLQSRNSEIKQNPELLKSVIRAEFLPFVQVKYAGALILGNAYKNATETQRTKYFAAFENYLVQAVAQALSLYNGQTYQVEAEKNYKDKTVVSIRVLLLAKESNQQPIRIDVQWRKNSVSGEWKAYDLIAEGVSMLTTKQNEWATTLRQEGIDALTVQLQKLSEQRIDPSKSNNEQKSQ